MRLGQWLGLAGLASSLAACQSDRSVAFERLGAISTSATASEINYVRQAIATDCRADLLQRTFESATAGKVLDINQPCRPFADQQLLDQYDALVKGIAAYATALQAEQAAGGAAALDDASKALATQFDSASQAGGVLAKLGPGQTVTKAANSIASWILGRVTYRNAHAAAQAQAGNLRIVVDGLKSVNNSIAVYTTSLRNQRLANFNALGLKTTNANPASAFIAQWHLLQIEGLEPGSVAAFTPDDFAGINGQLDALVRCNDSIARGEKHSATGCAAIGALAATTSSKEG